MRKTIALQTETRAYDAFQRLTSMTQFDGTAITYNYAQTANDGKIVSQVTTPSGGIAETVNYTYDSLGRLTQAATAGAGGWGLAWMYDGWGNRLQQSAVKGTVPTMVSTTDPATNRIQAHTYDANGNTTYTPQQGTMTYDVFNRLVTVAADTYGYDPANKRLWKNDEFTFWGASGERIGRYSAVKLIENQNGTLVHSFVFQKVQTDEYFGGRRLTTQDRLGSVGSYYPYGEAKSGTVSNADSFASYYRDSTGLDYAQNRYYVVGSGRFASSDPLDSSAISSDPSSWNRYAYTRGSPVNAIDPNGLADCPAGSNTSTTVCATSDPLVLVSSIVSGTFQYKQILPQGQIDYESGGCVDPRTGLACYEADRMRRECMENAPPSVPAGVSVEDLVTAALGQINAVIAEAVAIASDPLFSSVNGISPTMFVFNVVNTFLVNQVAPHHAWDWKHQWGHEYQAFGNWFFGVVTAHAGLGSTYSQFGAGVAQIWVDVSGGQMPSNLNLSTFGDQPGDAANITAGRRFLHGGCTRLGL